MFTVVVDGNAVYDPNLTSVGNAIFSPKLQVGLNKSGEFSFVVPPTNPFYDDIEQLSSRVFVLNDGSYEDVLFVGRVLNISIDFNKMKTVSCEGAMSFMVDSILRPYTFEGSPNELFEYYVGTHNATVDPDNTLGKRLTIGTVNVDSSTQVTEFSETYVSTIEELQNKLLDKYGGYIVSWWDYENERIVLDYINDIGVTNPQLIQYSRNLLDLVEEQPAEDVYTVAIPIGAQLFDEDTGESLGRVTLTDYPNDGDPDYVEAPAEFISRFGRIEKTFEFDYITDQADLYTIGQYLVSFSAYIPSRLSIKAIDLGLVDPTFKKIKVGNLLSVVSPPHGVDRQMLCTAIDYDLFEPGNTVYDFEIETTYTDPNTLSKRQNDTEHKIRTMYGQNLNVVENAMSIAEQHIADARTEASAEIAEAMGGYVYKTQNELYIMDQPELRLATKVWRWNMGGLGYWSGQAGHATDPDAQYTVALTASGTANADILRGELVDTVRFNAAIGTVGGWTLSASDISKTVEDEDDPTKIYKVRLFPPSTTNPGTSKVLSLSISNDTGATFSDTFYLLGNGSFHISSPNSDGAERVRIFERSTPANSTIVNSNGVHINKPRQGFIASQAHLFSNILDFRDSNGKVTASYSGDGWFDVEVVDAFVTGGKTIWKVLVNGPYALAICKREFTNVVVDYHWGNIFCGTSSGYGCNFLSVGYPYKFDSVPYVVAQLDTHLGGNDGWLVTNEPASPQDPTWYAPAYDLARGGVNATTVPSITVNYFVLGRIEDTYSITQNLTNVSSSNEMVSVYENVTYTTTLTAETGYIMDSVTVKMGGSNITSTAYTSATGVVNIQSVTGAIEITAEAVLDDAPSGD